MEDKEAIRTRIINLRNNFSCEEVINKSKKITAEIFKLPEFEEAEVLLLYADYKNEVMTRDIFDMAIIKKKKVYFPKCVGNGLNFYQVVSIGELSKGAFNILEPSNKAKQYKYEDKTGCLAIIPGVAFDVEGNRLGFGKGFYDRFLKEKPFITKVGICYNEQLEEKLPSNEYDIKMDKIVTENIVYSFLRI